MALVDQERAMVCDLLDCSIKFYNSVCRRVIKIKFSAFLNKIMLDYPGGAGHQSDRLIEVTSP